MDWLTMDFGDLLLIFLSVIEDITRCVGGMLNGELYDAVCGFLPPGASEG